MSTNTRELSGLKLAVKAGPKHFRNRMVLVKTDNKATQAYINHLGDRSVFLSSIAQETFGSCAIEHTSYLLHSIGQARSMCELIVSPTRSTMTPTSVSSRRSLRSSVQPALSGPICNS